MKAPFLGSVLGGSLLLRLLVLLNCHCVATGHFPNRTTSLGEDAAVDSTLAVCSLPSCSISLLPVTLSYPTLFVLVESTATASVIPVVTLYPNGTEVTETSTFAFYNTQSNRTFASPKTHDLTWETFDTTLTYPTTYVAYPTPNLVVESPVRNGLGTNGPMCALSTFEIPIPRTATPQLVFPRTSDAEYPGSDVAFSYLNALPTVSSLLSGGNPSTCYHGVPTTETRSAANTPVIFPVEPITHTSVSVLTEVGRPVTLVAPPFGDDDSGSQPTGNDGGDRNGGANGGNGSGPQSQQLGTTPAPGEGSNPITRIVIGGNTIEQQPSGIIVNGQTITQGAAPSTFSDGVVVSVGSSATAVIAGGSTLTLSSNPAGATGTASNQSPGGAIASGINASQNSATGKFDLWIIALEGIVIFGFPGVLALL